MRELLVEHAQLILLSEHEFSGYKGYAEAVLARIGEVGVISPELVELQQLRASVAAELRGRPVRAYLWRLVSYIRPHRTLVSIVSAAVLGTGLTLPMVISDSFRSLPGLARLLLAVALPFFVFLGIWAVWMTRQALIGDVPTNSTAGLARRYEEVRLETARHLDTEAKQAIRDALSYLLRRENVILLPDRAPALVELSAAKIVSTSSLERVEQFLHEHEASALGLAGPRGSGKSTILRVMARSSPGTVGFYLPSPVRYAPGEIARQIHLGLAQGILESASFSEFHHLRRVRTIRSRVLATMILALLTAIIMREVLPRSFTESWFLLLLLGIPALVMLAGSVIGGKSERGSSAHSAMGPAYASAASALQRLRYKEEREAKSTFSFEWLSARAGRDFGTSLTELDPTRADVVGSLRKFVAELVALPGIRRVVVAVDELDKLPEVEDVIGVVNDLKDLFHVSGVHFLVAVSNEALDRFRLRGLPARDAFDSAFDAIMEIGQLDDTEAQIILDRRAVGFPRAVALFCWVWSAGVARDLIRLARRCVEAARTLETPSMRAVIDQVAAESIIERVSSALRATGAREQLTSHGVTRLRAALDEPVERIEELTGILEDPALRSIDPTVFGALCDWLHRARAILAAYDDTPRSHADWEEAAGDLGDLRRSLREIHAAHQSV